MGDNHDTIKAIVSVKNPENETTLTAVFCENNMLTTVAPPERTSSLNMDEVTTWISENVCTIPNEEANQYPNVAWLESLIEDGKHETLFQCVNHDMISRTTGEVTNVSHETIKQIANKRLKKADEYCSSLSPSPTPTFLPSQKKGIRT